jgi:hypothetical protein
MASMTRGPQNRNFVVSTRPEVTALCSNKAPFRVFMPEAAVIGPCFTAVTLTFREPIEAKYGHVTNTTHFKVAGTVPKIGRS